MGAVSRTICGYFEASSAATFAASAASMEARTVAYCWRFCDTSDSMAEMIAGVSSMIADRNGRSAVSITGHPPLRHVPLVRPWLGIGRSLPLVRLPT